jgi:DNA polymerase I
MFTIDDDTAKKDFLDCFYSGVIKETDRGFLYEGKPTQFEFKIDENFGTDRFLYGKNKTKDIVNISLWDDNIFVFKKDYSYETYPFKPWVLSPTSNSSTKRLKGNQHYKYIKEYNSLAELNEVKRNIYRLNLYHINNPSESFMVRNGFTYYKGMTPSQVSLLSFDIETTGLNSDAKDAKVLLITAMFRDGNGNSESVIYNVSDYSSDKDMIHEWCMWVQSKDSQVLLGHNIVMFDIPYLVKRYGGPLPLGKYESCIDIEERTRELRKDGSQSYSYNRISCFGREIVDTFFLAIKFDIGRKYESYRLKTIIAQEGLEKEGRQHYDAGNISKNWHIPEERAKIIEYAKDDAEDPIKLWDLMIPSFFYMSQYVPKTLQMMMESATGSQLNSMMVRSYIQDDFSVAKADETGSFEGAISYGNPGIFRNCYKVDVASLYPSIMLQYGIESSKKDFNHVLLSLLNKLRNERLKNKSLAKNGDRYYDDLQNAQKVLINSIYGFMGASGLNYNYPEGAAMVTKKGREILQTAIKWATGVDYDSLKEGTSIPERFQLTNCDTDSIMFNKLDMEGFTEDERKSLLDELNSLYPDLIRFEDDGYFHTVICLKAKNYVLYDGKKIKMKGSSIKDQKKEPALKEMLDAMLDDIIFNKAQGLQQIYHKYIMEALNPTDIKRWCQKKTLTKSITNCATDPTARTNEKVIWEAVKDKQLQEGDKFYVYPTILEKTIETTELKNGKTKEKEIIIKGLREVSDWSNDHDSDKLVERVVSTVDILSNVVDKDLFLDYSLKKNRPLLEGFCAKD